MNLRPMRYSPVLVDADDTLFDFYAAEEHALGVTLGDLGYHEPFSSYIPQFREINTRAWADYEAGRATSQEIRVRRFGELFSLLSLTAHPRQVSDTYVRHPSEASHLLPGARDALIRRVLEKAEKKGAVSTQLPVI
mgnify:CR=1 FL=1